MVGLTLEDDHIKNNNKKVQKLYIYCILLYISTTITTIKVPLEMEETPPHKLLTLSTLLHSLHLHSLSVQGVKEVKGAQGSGRLRCLRGSRGGQVF